MVQFLVIFQDKYYPLDVSTPNSAHTAKFLILQAFEYAIFI